MGILVGPDDSTTPYSLRGPANLPAVAEDSAAMPRVFVSLALCITFSECADLLIFGN